MKVRKLSIKNFRGISQLVWNPPDQNIVCLIGCGDSGKTTILEALRLGFHPQWNLAFNDSDFYLCKTEDPIQLEFVIGDLPDEFCSDQKYGAHLQGWDLKNALLHDEPEDTDETVLSVRLTVMRDLEPKWKIITARNPEGIDFRAADRAKVNVGLIGAYSEKQLTWTPGSALARITQSDSLNESLVDATRAARNSLDAQRDEALTNFDVAARKSEAVAKKLGIHVAAPYQAHLDLSTINIKLGGLSLHEGNIPLRLLGLGSRRMLLCGIQTENLETKHITLFDELELGLEPHRIAQLIKHIKEDRTGQYFLTTHSPSVLRELSVEHLHVVRKTSDCVEVIATNVTDPNKHNIQGQLRSSPEAFLSVKVIVCEGATEVGFLRGLDNYWTNSELYPLSYIGAVLLDAHGASRVTSLALGFKALHYDVFVVADGDAPDQFSPENIRELEESGVDAMVWSDGLALEERAMLDLPWDSVLASVTFAKSLDFDVHANVRSKLNVVLDDDITKWPDSIDLRKAIGSAAKAKKSPWFKSISHAEQWFSIIQPALSDTKFKEQDLAIKLGLLRKWLGHG